MESDTSAVVELRQYTLHPGRRDELIELFEREFIEPQREAGMELLGLFRDEVRPDRFVWVRGFPDMESRKHGLATFYGGPVWRAHRDSANATMIDSDNVLLLRPARPRSGLASQQQHLAPGPLVVATYSFADSASCNAFAHEFEEERRAELERTGVTVLGTYVTLAAENTFPALPVREGEHCFVVFMHGTTPQHLEQRVPGPAEISVLTPTSRSAIQVFQEGRAGDFEFLRGDWNVTHRRLRERLAGSNDWDEFRGTSRGYSLLDGIVSIDEMDFPTRGFKGCAVRHLDLATKLWSIYWIDSKTGRLFPPVHGSFDSNLGEFYGDDVEGGTPVRARYIWKIVSPDIAHWEQAFSTDGGATWETNWIMDFVRV